MAAARRIAKRKRETEVWIDDERIPEKKLKKEIARYDYEVAFPYRFEGKYLPKDP